MCPTEKRPENLADLLSDSSNLGCLPAHDGQVILCKRADRRRLEWRSDGFYAIISGLRNKQNCAKGIEQLLR